MPSDAMTMNQSGMMGPKALEILSVPKRCTMKRIVTTAMANGTTKAPADGKLTVMPSPADSTDTAGVMTPSA